MPDVQRLDTDEINLKELFRTLWLGKLMIFITCGVALVAGSIYLHGAERSYSVQAIYKPVAEDKQAPNLGGLGGLASLAGISMPSSSGSDFKAFQALLVSQEVSDILMEDSDLIRYLFESEWNADSKTFRKPTQSQLGVLKNNFKKILTGSETLGYTHPDSRRLSNMLKKIVSVSEDPNTGYLTISAETSNPQLRINVIQKIATITDDLLKRRYVSNAEETLAFYQDRIALARSREQREALAKLMAQEEQRLMLASRGKNFVVEPLMRPTASLYPTSPKPFFILSLCIGLGGFLGSVLVLIRASAQSRGEKLNA